MLSTPQPGFLSNGKHPWSLVTPPSVASKGFGYENKNQGVNSRHQTL